MKKLVINRYGNKEYVYDWRILFEEEALKNNEDFGDIIYYFPPDLKWEQNFKSGYEKDFTVWTNEHVYFPATYDGTLWVASVPRSPCERATAAVGC